MTPARRGSLAAAVLGVGLLALLLTPGVSRADTSSSSPSSSTPLAKPTPTPTPCTVPQRVTGNCPSSVPLPGSSTTLTDTDTTTTTTMTPESTFSYANPPGSAQTIPPTASPQPKTTPQPTPDTELVTGETGSTSTTTTDQANSATTVVSPQAGGESSSVLPLTVLAILVIVGAGAAFLMTRLR